jgi:hypothetical protein
VGYGRRQGRAGAGQAQSPGGSVVVEGFAAVVVAEPVEHYSEPYWLVQVYEAYLFAGLNGEASRSSGAVVIVMMVEGPQHSSVEYTVIADYVVHTKSHYPVQRTLLAVDVGVMMMGRQYCSLCAMWSALVATQESGHLVGAAVVHGLQTTSAWH